MKNSILFVLSLTALTLSAHASEILSPKQKSEALIQIDNQAGDSIDEGDCEFSFKSISCDDSTNICSVGYKTKCYNDLTKKSDPMSSLKICSVDIGSERNLDPIIEKVYDAFNDAKCE